MAIVEWSEDFKLGEAEIDRKHWGLFALTNDLSDQHAQGAGDASTIDAWAAYVGVDFEHEERLMRTVGYPKLDSHIELHVALARRVEEYKAAFERQAARFDSNGFTAFLTDHILHEDMQFAKYHHRH